MCASVYVLERIQRRENYFKSIILIQVSCALLSRIYPLIVIIVITGLMGAVCGCGCARNDWKKKPRENWDNIISLISLQFCIFDLWINMFFSDSGVERKVVDKKCWRKSGPELISRLRRKQEATLLRRRLLPSQSRMRHKIWNIFHPGCFPTESFLDSVCEWFPSVFLL